MKRYFQLLLLPAIMLMMHSCYDNGISRSDGGTGLGGDAGTGGSMARFAISDNELFLINEKSLIVYDISSPSGPVEINRIEAGIGIETVFTLKDLLFIGSVNGVYIYDITDPRSLLYLSHYQHVTSCDPVVANDSLAFATLNSQSQCRWQTGANQLDVIDISNLLNPSTLATLPLEDPKGLAIDSTFVFVCNGSQGVSVFDFTDPEKLSYVTGIQGIDSYDVILQDHVLYLVGKDGLFQYDVSNLDQIKLLSNLLF